MELLAARSRKDEAVLIPVYLRPFDLKPFGWDKQQLLPGEPIQAWERDRRDEVWATVATRIRKEAEELKDKRRQATPPAWSLPDRDLSFFGRDELLDGLWTAFADRKGPKVCALVGAANIGKTWAAKEFAWRHRTEQDYDSVKRPEMIEPLLPEGRLKGHVLITTEQGWRDRTAGQVRLGGFSPDEAKHFLLASGDVDPPTAEELARQLNFVPPALAAAVAYVQSGEGLLADYLGFLTSTRDEGGR